VQRNGFTFDGIDANSLNSALDRAMEMYKSKPEAWRDLEKKNMQVGCGGQGPRCSGRICRKYMLRGAPGAQRPLPQGGLCKVTLDRG
jgi:hypothetical protein